MRTVSPSHRRAYQYDLYAKIAVVMQNGESQAIVRVEVVHIQLEKVRRAPLGTPVWRKHALRRRLPKILQAGPQHH